VFVLQMVSQLFLGSLRPVRLRCSGYTRAMVAKALKTLVLRVVEMHGICECHPFYVRNRTFIWHYLSRVRKYWNRYNLVFDL
jgi:ribosomal protein L31